MGRLGFEPRTIRLKAEVRNILYKALSLIQPKNTTLIQARLQSLLFCTNSDRAAIALGRF